MPQHSELDSSKIEEMVQGGGLSKATMQKWKYFKELFIDYVLKHYKKSAMDVIQDPKELEAILLKYFGSLKVQNGQKVLLPKKNYLDSIFSNTKLFIMAETENKIDISSKYAFPLLENLMKSLHKLLKEEGRADTKSYEAIEDHSLKRIFSFIGQVVRVIKARGTEKYPALVAQLPETVPGRIHHMLQVCSLGLFKV